jgi:hypothetical protein
MTWFIDSPLALPLRILSLPVAAPLIFIANAATNNLGPTGGPQSFLSALAQYITGSSSKQ